MQIHCGLRMLRDSLISLKMNVLRHHGTFEDQKLRCKDLTVEVAAYCFSFSCELQVRKKAGVVLGMFQSA